MDNALGRSGNKTCRSRARYLLEVVAMMCETPNSFALSKIPVVVSWYYVSRIFVNRMIRGPFLPAELSTKRQRDDKFPGCQGGDGTVVALLSRWNKRFSAGFPFHQGSALVHCSPAASLNRKLHWNPHNSSSVKCERLLSAIDSRRAVFAWPQ